jgi:hypothetical protein
MKAIIRKIDRALKRIYNLETHYWAERFLLRGPLREFTARNAGLQGAVLVQNGRIGNIKETDQTEDLSVGIFFSEKVKKELLAIRRAHVKTWTTEQMQAFAVATEEISHFNYLIHNAVLGRSVSQLELEMQGEVDKFLLAFFTLTMNRDARRAELFQGVFDQLFERFHWAEHLTEEQKERYAEANHCAQKFILKCRYHLAKAESYENAFRVLRLFYRLSASEKISFARRA